MTLFELAHVAIFILFGLMAARAFRSGTATDYLLGGVQCPGLLSMLGDYRQIGAWLLMVTSVAYLASQVMTGARPISRALPIVAALVIALYLAGGYV